MIKTVGKFVLVATVASMAVAMSMTPSLAAKKKAAKVEACKAPAYCHACVNGVCNTKWCGADGKWYSGVTFCVEPFCVTPKCPG